MHLEPAAAADGLQDEVRRDRHGGARPRLLLRRDRPRVLDLRRPVRAAELPCEDEERRDADDPRDCRQYDARVDPPMGRARARAAGPRDDLVVADDVARVVLVDVELPVQAEVLGVRAQEALDVRLGREGVELLVLQSAQVPRADLRRLLELGKVELLAQARLAEAVPDLEHRPILGGIPGYW